MAHFRGLPVRFQPLSVRFRGLSTHFDLELLEEAIRMRRAPGILFADGPSGRRAVVAGIGLDVWEVISTWRRCKEEEAELRQCYPWLTEPQIRAALSYYRLYPQEIDIRLEREAQWTPERVWRELPFARPHRQ